MKLEGNDRLVFGRLVHHQDATAFRRLVHKQGGGGTRGFTFDFENTKFAAPVAMAQLVVQTEAFRNEGMHFDVIPPSDAKTRRIFEHSNWAHHLSPVNYDLNDTQPDGWLPVARYTSNDELVGLVNHTCSVVLRETNIRRPALHGLEWALNEMADNVFQHAQSPGGGLAAVTVAAKRRKVQFVVADAGVGIPATIRTGHRGLRTDFAALQHAAKQGVTRDRRIGAGNGLAGALRIATAAQGSFSVSSGRAFLHAGASDPQLRGHTKRPNDALDGTVVYFEMTVNRDFDLEKALLEDGISIADWDFLDAAYSPEGRDIRIDISAEATSTGTRVAARPVRRQVRNLVYARPDVRIVLDFTSVERVTASFADELVGRLLVSLGPDRFNSRIALTGLDHELVRAQIARSAGQRAQEARDAQARRRRSRRKAKRRRPRSN